MSPIKLSQEKADRAISWVLRYGAILSTLVMAVGIGLALWRGPSATFVAYERIRPKVFLANLIKLEPGAVTEMGILLLLFTPIIRIIVAAATFAFERDHKYLLISLGVLAVLIFSISLAIES